MHRLTEIANRQNCDKGTTRGDAHGYTEVYGLLIPEKSACKILEVGVHYGNSIRMWNEYNPGIEHHAIEINPECMAHMQHLGGTSHIIYGDAVLEKTVDQFNDEMFDFIIDDGSHKAWDQQTTLVNLFRLLKPGGTYFIEDLHVMKDHKDDRSNTINMLNNWINYKKLKTTIYTRAEAYFLSKLILTISYHCDNKLAIIKKVYK